MIPYLHEKKRRNHFQLKENKALEEFLGVNVNVKQINFCL